MPSGLLVSAPASGTGKTTLMLGLLRALQKRGMAVQPFKSGPDYIDPGFHRAATGRPSVNLDSWAMGPDMISSILTLAQDSDLTIAEGSMGLFDGVASIGATGTGASSDIAALTGWPVVLVLDISGQAQSAAAIAKGFAELRPGVNLAGVVLNRVASPRHDALTREGMKEAGITVFGSLPRRKDVEMPERHLGLVQAQDQSDLSRILDALADFISEHVDLDAICKAANPTSLPSQSTVWTAPPPGERIALARDAAFSFVYPHLIDAWRKAGATILPFSPLADEMPDPSADICWLPGGYPELHAGKLAAAQTYQSALRDFAKTRPVHGECGGYMAMGEALIDKEGTHHKMAGLLGLVTSYEKRKMHLGYRRAELLAPVPGYKANHTLRGHEFHYSTITEQPDAPLAKVYDANGDAVIETGSYRGHATGTFFHLIAEASQ
ncbi:MAG: cobyrinate a,c-diamide synthase [Cohaesibacter sp.]|nr:cobyrinate a,c-diamide synthase [Cohaesibacter sp.]